MDDVRLVAVVTTVGSAHDAQRLAREAVQARLAACVQHTRIDSVYRWQGAVHEEAEWRLLFKTTTAASAALQAWLKQRHPYALPAIYTLAVAQADAAYAAWVREQTDAGHPDG